jgi:Domain of unknown function (DUF305)
MIAHHEAAIPMAQAVLKRTDEPEVSQLATSIITSQKAEIENMKGMVEKMVGNSAQVELESANGSQTTGTATLSKADGGGVKVVLKVSELPNSGTMYLAHSILAPAPKRNRAEQNTATPTTSTGLQRRSSTPSRRSTRTTKALGRARRWCTTSRSKACSLASLSTSTSTSPALESLNR